jgi:photosystem II stability/assembly factor-like uncharacterized protein
MGVFKSLATSLLALCLCIPSIAEQVGQIKSMKLLTPDIGWASTSQKLFWTADAGAHWKDITPKLHHKWQMVSSVFFIDSSSGWVVLKCADRTNNAADDPCFEVASTTNAGETWSVVHPKIVDPDPDSGFSEQAYLDFADKNRGWMILKISKNVAVSSGVMMRTEDGGKTWKQMPAPPIADQLRFINAEDGWMAGGPDQELYSTHDAGTSWQRVELNAPQSVSSDLSPVCDLPVFEARQGYLAVAYESSVSLAASIVLFRTDDGGKTWHPAQNTTAVPITRPWSPIPWTVANGGTLIAMITSGHLNLSWFETGSVSKNQSSALPVHAKVPERLSFASAQRGWLLASQRLFLTTNGGGVGRMSHLRTRHSGRSTLARPRWRLHWRPSGPSHSRYLHNATGNQRRWAGSRLLCDRS